MKNSVNIVLAVFFIMPVLFWLVGIPEISLQTLLMPATIVKLTALIGGSGYLATFIFSSRHPLVERYIMPLDRSYKMHRLLGTLGGSGILLHVTSLIANILPSTNALKLYLLPGTNFAYSMGIIAFYGVLLLLFTTFYAKLPYHIWSLLHKITGFSLLFSLLHIFFIPSDTSVNILLQGWFYGLGGVALLSWIYRRFFYSTLSFSTVCEVSDVLRMTNYLKITMKNPGGKINPQPGQFAFFSFVSNTKVMTKEAHPFTFLEVDSQKIAIAVKYSGDFTYRLQQVQPGDKVKIAGPYGGFGKPFIHSSRHAVWVAGGIGVTPFINLLQYAQKSNSRKEITFFYTTKQEDDFFHPLIQGYTTTVPLRYEYFSTERRGRIAPESIVNSLQMAPQHYDYFLCGPKPLTGSVISYLSKIGIPSGQIHLEDFDFKDMEV